ncbi:MAG: ATP-binding protein [Betaproteobacteria bacterium HGW-Betaproteobacteria-13]|jgi:signal transduction histidine kinase|uniref:histidine kinase n=1 Tax=Parazoarcus communis TaxID=41977 RepID=A0A2U8H7S3_9RHOO|nr:sensor histidine kinase [Parazoarcus communis]AWI81743.1 ATP-binding protein [Parazoarcus communis]PKO80901.1 MAG: ATP-binding protein [Betaproteobacteria bacterium HGW-Betaproteobacteria-13]
MRSVLSRVGSLRFRLLAGSLVWILAALTLSGFFLADLFREHVAARVHAELRVQLDQLTANVEVGDELRPKLLSALSDPRLQKPYSGLYWQVDGEGANGVGLLRSRSLWDTVLTVPADHLDDGQLHRHLIGGPGGAMLVMMERVVRPADHPDLPLRLIVAVDEQTMEGPVREFVGLLVLALCILAAGLAAAVFIQVWAGLAPLRRLRSALADVRDGRARALEGRFPDEVHPLVDEFNAVLGRDAEVVMRARTQAGNLAHAVKTPLAILANAAAAEDSALARLVAEQVGAARRQVDYHLARARAAAAVQVPGVRTPLRPALEALLRVMRRLHPDQALSVEWRGAAGDAVFRGEEQDLQEMLGNLLDNACKWAASRVDVKVSVIGQGLVVSIDDDGPGLAPEARQAVFERGVRTDELVPGSGLGLGIVDDLARLYGGAVVLEASPGGGLRAVLSLPAG